MENKKKTIVLLACVTMFAGKKENVKVGAHSSNSVQQQKQVVKQPADSEKIYLGNSLYKNKKGEIFLKVKNRSLNHPSQMGKLRKEFLYLGEVYVNGKDEPVLLGHTLDVNTFKQVNELGSYFMDSSSVYVYNFIPRHAQFFALARGGERFLGSGKEFLLHKNTLYFEGEIVRDIDTNNLSIVRFKKKDKSGFLEFVADDKSIFYGNTRLDKRDLDDMAFGKLSEVDKNRIVKRYFLK